jgi:hypothetical protein
MFNLSALTGFSPICTGLRHAIASTSAFCYHFGLCVKKQNSSRRHNIAMIARALLPLLLLLQSGPVLVDKIAATVNDEIITVHDIERAIALLPVTRQGNESEADFYFRVLNERITCKAVALEFADEFNLSEEDFETVQTQILQKAGSLEKLRSILRNFDMSWEEFRSFIRENVLYEKVLKEKFQLEITIPFNEIEEFFHRDYLPSQLQLSLEPRSLVEMAPGIEKYLRLRRMEKLLSAWLDDIRAACKIEIKLRSPQ